jgi:hypothetical protein
MEKIFRYCKVYENCCILEFKKFYQDKFLSDPELDHLTRKEIQFVNEICVECSQPLFINKRECPACGSENLQPPYLITGGKFGPSPDGGIKIHNYRCGNCDRVLSSHLKLL